MDCKTARLLLDLARPNHAELDPTDLRELQRHLSSCPECETVSRAEQQLDQHLGRAIRQVEVPAGLRSQILARLEGQRGDWFRQRYGHAIRALAAAALILGAVWGWFLWRAAQLPVVDVEALVMDVSVAPPGPDKVNAFLKSMGLETNAPDPLKVSYAFLTSFGVSELPGHPGKQVPELVFTHFDRGQLAVAKLYILSAKQFQLQDLLRGVEPPLGYRFKLEMLPPEPGDQVVYLILYTGANLDWLKPRQQINL
jgi:hypothetical protein